MMHEKHKQWLDARSIDPVLAEKLGLTTEHRGDGHWLVIPYCEQGRIVNRKYRLTSEKRHRMDEGAPLGLWNSDCLSHPEVLAGASVVITEGEFDALAALTAGLRHVVSVPNGAPSSQTKEPATAKRYAFIERHRDALDRVQTFVIATDGDQPGRNLANDLAVLLGADRCRFVRYPDGCKDLNDVALFHSHQAILDLILGAKPWPIKGLFKPSDFPPPREMEAWPTGLRPLDGHLYIVPGTLTVFTGYANIGKSTVLSAIMGEQIKAGRGVCIAPFETGVPILLDSIRQAICSCSKAEMANLEMSDVNDLIEQKLTIIHQAVEDDDEDMDLDYLLDLMRVAVRRDGAKICIIDPWNEIEHKTRPGETETQYLNRAVRHLRRFAVKYNVALWVIVHPVKPESGDNSAPKLYRAAGSAAWANKPDFGLSYHRRDPSANAGELHVAKVRMGYPGKKTDKDGIRVMLDYRTWEFVELAA